MDKKCSKCGALFYPGEVVRGADASYAPCCSNGAVSLPTTYDDFPRSIYELLKWEHPLSADFHRHVRNYNSALSFASINCNLDRRYTGPGGPYCFRINGSMYTLFNNGTHAEGVPSYAQLYVVDSEQATDYRMQHQANEGVDRELLRALDQDLRRVNPHAQSYQMLRQVEDEQMRHERQQAEVLRAAGMEVEEPELPSFKLLFKLPRNVDRRRYNIPRANEIAAVFRTNADGSIPPTELIVQSATGRTFRLSTLSPLVAPFTFPLLFPTGKEGWTPMMPLARATKNRLQVSRREYLSHQIQVRSDRHDNIVFNPLHYAGKLFQEYVVINYVHVEGDRLEWVRSNQAELRAHDYRGLHDKIDELCKKKNVAKNVTVLPATFPGSPRYMQRNYEDAMAVVRRFGKPDLFLTMTCNPNWQEIVENLGVKPNGTPVDASTGPDLLARVFYLKLKKLIEDIKGRNGAPGCFGKLKTFVYTVEYQKRGLPHVHMLITLDNANKLKTANDIDKVISAKIPDQQRDPLLYELVKSNMVHGPCDQASFPCLDVKGNCTKKFPKAFLEQTRLEEDGYPLYRRSQNGRELLYGNGPNPRRADNRWIVPYCPALLKKYNCHMNVEIVQGIRAVKYLYKYIFKGFDRAYMEIAPTDTVLEWDEIAQHLDARYVSSSEAWARLLRKSLHGRKHAVIRLHVHKPGHAPTAEELADADDPVAGDPEQDEEAVGEAYDNLIQIDPVEEPAADVAAAQPAAGNGRVGGNHDTAPPMSDGEGDEEAESAGDNRPCGSNRNIAPPSKSTLLAWLAYNAANEDGRHLTYVEFSSHFRFVKDKNGAHWAKRAKEVNVIGRLFNVSPRDQEAYNLRLLLFYVKGCKSFEDIRTVSENGVDTIHPTFTAAALARGLIEDDEEHIKTMEEAVTYAIGPRLRRFFVMLLVHCEIKDPKAFWDKFKVKLAEDLTYHLGGDEPRGIALAYAEVLDLLSLNGKSRERDFPDLPAPTIELGDGDAFLPEIETLLFEQMKATLYEEQLEVVRFVEDYLDRGCRGNNCIYVGGLGGSGKTYLYKALYHLIRSHPNGGPDVNMASTGIAATLLPTGRTVHSAFALPAKAFVLDEVSMCSKFVLECVSRTLSKMHKSDQPFGNVLMIIGGDFRQCIPIKQRALPSELFDLCVKRSELWARFKKFTLKRNVRALADPDYAQYAVDIGDGVGIRQTEGDVPLMAEIVSTGDLVHEVYGELKTRYGRMLESQRMDFLAERAILCPLNSEVNHYNEVVLNGLPGDVATYRSYDMLDVDATAESQVYPPELLNTLNPSSLPPHELNVKEGAVVML
ncbi:hypothetical protein AAVH_19195 [Aphelenchoides avenae]|nr:hypothetical protein AAVH_19195 [Aphelenchus avenae]